MNKLVNSLSNIAYTENGAITNASTLDGYLDIFSDIGNPLANEDKFRTQILNLYKEDPSLTLRLLAYGRDILEGTGRRDKFVFAFNELLKQEANSPLNTQDLVVFLMRLINSGMSYWKDMFKLYTTTDNPFFKVYTVDVIHAILFSENEDKMLIANLAKWMPRKGDLFNAVRRAVEVTPKELRKLIVQYTNVVEQKMCANNWREIDFSKIPGRASKMYSKTFSKRSETSERYVKFLQDAADGKVKLNVGKTVTGHEAFFGQSKEFAQASFVAMLDKMNASTKKVLVVSDTSGSMYGTPIQVCLSLTALFGTKLTGDFHNCTIAFSERPRFIHWADTDTITERIEKITTGDCPSNTDLQKVFDLILSRAQSFNVPQSDMPEVLMIISDMQFDQAITYGRNGRISMDNIQLMKQKFEDAGYQIPQIIFWNVNAYGYDNKPVTKDERGIMVSGYSQNIWNSMMSIEDLSNYSPYKFMMETLNKDRYLALVNN